jgi:hypothetical protein
MTVGPDDLRAIGHTIVWMTGRIAAAGAELVVSSFDQKVALLGEARACTASNGAAVSWSAVQ